MDRTSLQIDLERGLHEIKRKISMETDPAKKSRLMSAYEDLVEMLKA